MKVQVTEIKAGDRVWNNGSTDMVASVRFSPVSGTYTVTWNGGSVSIVREDKTWTVA